MIYTCNLSNNEIEYKLNDFFFHSYPVSILNFGIYLERNSVFYQVLHLNKFDILKLSLNESELIVAI